MPHRRGGRAVLIPTPARIDNCPAAATLAAGERLVTPRTPVGRGEIVDFVGPNGAGKTTTLRMIATLLPIEGATRVLRRATA